MQGRIMKGLPLGLGFSFALGRCKIADHWKPTTYKVVSCPQENVYKIKLADGTGPTKRVVRTELLDTKEMVPDNAVEGWQEMAGEEAVPEVLPQQDTPHTTDKAWTPQALSLWASQNQR